MKWIQGYTVVELMVTLLIAVMLFLIGIPGFAKLLETDMVATVNNEVLYTIILTRYEAIARESNVKFSVCGKGHMKVVARSGDIVVDRMLDNEHITVVGNSITYNELGVVNFKKPVSVDISYDDVVVSRICLSRIGRPYIRLAEQGACL